MIQSVNRAIRILSLFSRSSPSLGITEISQALKLAKGTVHGLVSTLAENEYLQKDSDTGKYRLGLKIFELGTIMSETLEINQKSQQAIHQLAIETGFLVKLAVWDGFSVMVTMSTRTLSSGNERAAPQVGPRIPAYCSALGKVILAHLEQDEIVNYLAQTELIPFTPGTITRKEVLLIELEKTRDRGYARAKGEVLLGTACLAAPIFNRKGQVMAAISLSAAPDQLLEENETKYSSRVLETAGRISREMGYFPEGAAYPH